jgi:hypothetical protein
MRLLKSRLGGEYAPLRSGLSLKALALSEFVYLIGDWLNHAEARQVVKTFSDEGGR